MLYYLGKGTEFKKEDCKEYKTIEGAMKAAAKDESFVVWDENGNIIQPPWKEYDLQIQTALPVHQLAERLKAPSVRFISVTRQLENGRFHYQFTGKYYAR